MHSFILLEMPSCGRCCLITYMWKVYLVVAVVKVVVVEVVAAAMVEW